VLFTLAISADCRGFISISDWLHSYQEELLAIFCPTKNRLPSSNIFALGRDLALNLYRDYEFDNMAQAQRRAGQGRMK